MQLMVGTSATDESCSHTVRIKGNGTSATNASCSHAMHIKGNGTSATFNLQVTTKHHNKS